MPFPRRVPAFFPHHGGAHAPRGENAPGSPGAKPGKRVRNRRPEKKSPGFFDEAARLCYFVPRSDRTPDRISALRLIYFTSQL